MLHKQYSYKWSSVSILYTYVANVFKEHQFATCRIKINWEYQVIIKFVKTLDE